MEKERMLGPTYGDELCLLMTTSSDSRRHHDIQLDLYEKFCPKMLLSRKNAVKIRCNRPTIRLISDFSTRRLVRLVSSITVSPTKYACLRDRYSRPL